MQSADKGRWFPSGCRSGFVIKIIVAVVVIMMVIATYYLRAETLRLEARLQLHDLKETTNQTTTVSTPGASAASEVLSVEPIPDLDQGPETNADNSAVFVWDPVQLLKTQSINRESMRKALPDFVDVWARRPHKNNHGGMAFHHQFLVWYCTRHIKPRLIIESGVNRGGSTYLLHNAAPDAKIISFDPKVLPDLARVPGVEYRIGKDFIDLLKYPWANVDPELKRSALILLDDHHAAPPRLQGLVAAGFRGAYVVMDDNYPPLTGDNYSLKKIFDQTGSAGGPYQPGRPGDMILWTDSFNRVQKKITIEEHKAALPKIKEIIDTYIELPPPVALNFKAILGRVPPDKGAKRYTEAQIASVTPPPLFANGSELEEYIRHTAAAAAAPGAAAGNQAGGKGLGFGDVNWSKEPYVYMALAHLRSDSDANATAAAAAAPP